MFFFLGAKCGDSSQIWTNFWTGQGNAHGQYITVPFNCASDYHNYAIQIYGNTINWFVDNTVYRSEDVSGY